MKYKILILMICMVFLIGNVSAWNWDNSIGYKKNIDNKEDMRVKITNVFGLGKDLVDLELKSHSSVNYVKKVGLGKQVVMWYDVYGYEKYENGLGEVKFIDERTGKEVERDYEYVLKKKVEVDDYERVCSWNEKINNQTCVMEKSGSHFEERWVKLDNKNIRKGSYTIGIRVNVKENDYIDGIWTVAGKEISRHAYWKASLEAGLEAWLNFEETSGDVVDIWNYSYNGTNYGATRGVTGIINNAFDFEVTNTETVNITDLDDEVKDTGFTISVWLKPETITGYVYEIRDNDNTEFVDINLANGDGTVKFRYEDQGGGSSSVTSTTAINTTNWHHIVYVFNSTHILAYINGESEVNGSMPSGGLDFTSDDYFVLGDTGGGITGNNYDGKMDEFAFYTKVLGASEIKDLYNSRDATNPLQVEPAKKNITLNSPADGSTSNNRTQIFNYTPEFYVGNTTGGCDLYTDESGWNSKASNSTTVMNGTWNTIKDSFGSEGTFTWGVRCSNGTDWAWSTNNRTITIDTSPYISVFSPENNKNYPKSTIYFNATSNLSVDSWIVNYNGTNQTLSSINTTLDVEDGNFDLEFWGRNTVSGIWGLNDSYSFIVDTTPPTLNITYPLNTTYIDNYVTRNNRRISVNFTQSDSHIDTCWFLNLSSGNNETVTCGNNIIYTNLTYGTHTQYYWVNDTFGNEAGDEVTFTIDYNVLKNSVNYSAFAYETDTEKFKLNFTTTENILSVSGTLTYNGTEYSSTSECDEDTCVLTNNMNLPLISSSALNENRTFWWNFTIYNGTTSLKYNTSIYEQNVSRISLNVGGTDAKALNFTAWDEENLSRIMPYNFYGTFEYWLGDGSIIRSFSVSNISVNDTIIRIKDNLTYYIDAQIQYEKSNYLKRTYYMNNKTIDNNTEEINLLLLQETSSTSFIIKVIDEVQMPIEDVYVEMERYYPGEGKFRIVEMGLTDSSGKTVGHLEEETEDYRFIITEDGETIYESPSRKIYCEETPCMITLQIEAGAGVTWKDFGDLGDDFDWSLDYDEDKTTWTYTYTDDSGNTSQGRLLVYTKNGTQETTICNVTSPNPAATITCNVSGYDGTIYAEAFATQGKEILVYVKDAVVKTIKDILGDEGLLLAMFVLLMLGLIGLWNPTVGIILVSAGFIFINFIGLASFGTVTITGIMIVGVIFIWLLKT